MKINSIIKREIEVAFSKHSQSLSFRIAKYIFIGCIVFIFWGTRILWVILLVLFIFSLLLHFWYRYKTDGWARSYGGWDFDKNKSKLKDN